MVSETFLSGSESTSSLLLLNPLPRKEMRSKDRTLLHRGGTSLKLEHLELFSFYIRGCRGPGGSTPELAFLVIGKGAWSQGRDACSQQRVKAAPPSLQPKDCTLRNAPEITKRSTHQPEPNRFLLEPTVSIHLISSLYGRLEKFSEKQF